MEAPTKQQQQQAPPPPEGVHLQHSKHGFQENKTPKNKFFLSKLKGMNQSGPLKKKKKKNIWKKSKHLQKK